MTCSLGADLHSFKALSQEDGLVWGMICSNPCMQEHFLIWMCMYSRSLVKADTLHACIAWRLNSCSRTIKIMLQSMQVRKCFFQRCVMQLKLKTHINCNSVGEQLLLGFALYLQLAIENTRSSCECNHNLQCASRPHECTLWCVVVSALTPITAVWSKQVHSCVFVCVSYTCARQFILSRSFPDDAHSLLGEKQRICLAADCDRKVAEHGDYSFSWKLYHTIELLILLPPAVTWCMCYGISQRAIYACMQA